MGRTGTEINPDIVVGALNGVSIIMLSTYLVSVQCRPAECIIKFFLFINQNHARIQKVLSEEVQL